MFAGFCCHAEKNTFICFNSYNWLLRANIVLIWPSVKMSLTALALNLTSSEMMYRLPADFMAIYKYFLDLLFFIVKFFFNLKSSIISLFSR